MWPFLGVCTLSVELQDALRDAAVLTCRAWALGTLGRAQQLKAQKSVQCGRDGFRHVLVQSSAELAMTLLVMRRPQREQLLQVPSTGLLTSLSDGFDYADELLGIHGFALDPHTPGWLLLVHKLDGMPARIIANFADFVQLVLLPCRLLWPWCWQILVRCSF